MNSTDRNIVENPKEFGSTYRIRPKLHTLGGPSLLRSFLSCVSTIEESWLTFNLIVIKCSILRVDTEGTVYSFLFNQFLGVVDVLRSTADVYTTFVSGNRLACLCRITYFALGAVFVI